MNDDKDIPASHETHSNERQSSMQAAPANGFGVAASPFNAVKLELAILLILGVVLGLLLDSITHRDWVQIVVLACYGITAGGWILFRTRRVLARIVAQRDIAAPAASRPTDSRSSSSISSV